MTPNAPALAAAVVRHLPKEAGTLGPDLAKGDPKALKKLEGRAKTALRKVNQARPPRSFLMRCVLHLALLEAHGPLLDPAYDSLLKLALCHLPEELLLEQRDAIHQALLTLPEQRQAPLVRALNHRMIAHNQQRSAEAAQQLQLIQPQANQSILELLGQITEPNKTSHVNDDMGNHFYLHKVLPQLTEGWGGDPYPQWLFEMAEASLQGRDDDLSYDAVNHYGALILAMPPERRRALLLRHPRALLRQPALCQREDSLQALLRDDVGVTHGWLVLRFARRLAQRNPEGFALLLALLRQPATSALAFWEGARQELAPEHAPHLVKLIEADLPQISKQSAQSLARMPPQQVLEHLPQGWFPTQARGQRLAARVLRAWSLHSDQAALVDQLLPQVQDPQARATLEQARQPAAQQWRGALAQHLAAPDHSPPGLSKLWKKYQELREIQSGRNPGFYTQRASWQKLLPKYFDDPQALLLAVEVFTLTNPQHLTGLEEHHSLMGSSFVAAARAWWEASDIPQTARAFYPWLRQHTALSQPALMEVLRSGDLTLKQMALEDLPADDPEAMGYLTDMLTHKKASERTRAAKLMVLRPGKQAADALRAALDKERSKSGRAAMEEALQICDPTLRQLGQIAHDTGLYDLSQPYPQRDGLERLRALLYEEPTQLGWYHLCDLLERMEDAGGLQVALDYLTDEALARWSPELRALPMGWSQHPQLGALGQEDPDLLWFPIWRLTRPDFRQGALKALVKEVQANNRARLFTLDLVDTFLEATQAAWAWCQEEGVELEALEVSVDGGTIAENHITRAGATAMTLWMGFGVTVQRRNALQIGKQAAGVSQVRVALPPRHPARLKFELQGLKRHLDLRPLLGLGPSGPEASDP